MEELTTQKLLELKKKANKIRQLIITTLIAAGSGHTGGPLGMSDIYSAMYFHVLRHDPKNPNWDDRDRFILSCGHYCPVRYATMALAGYFPIEELKTLRKINSRLQGHPHRGSLPGVETTSGPLGEGLGQAIGMLLAAHLDKKDFYVYVHTSDGEHEEGNTWESVLLAGKLRLPKLIQILDYNNMQIDGPVKDIMPLDPIKEKYEAFNWFVQEIDGNDIEAFLNAVKIAQNQHDKPNVIIARTIPGKGVSFMENNYLWHGVPPDIEDVKGAPPKGEQAKVALEELKKIEEELNKE